MLNFSFLEKGLVLVSPPHFVDSFPRKMFFMLYSLNWPNLNAKFLHYLLNELNKNSYCWSRDMLNFSFSEKGLGLVSPHFVNGFPRKMQSQVKWEILWFFTEKMLYVKKLNNNFSHLSMRKSFLLQPFVIKPSLVPI